MFDENKSWKWNNSEGISTESGTFSLSFGEFGNNGIERSEVTEETEENRENDGNSDNTVEEEGLDESENEEGQEHVEEQGQSQAVPVLKKSERQVRRPSYLSDYVILAEIEGEHLLLAINEEPWDFKEANKLKVWRDACEEEIMSITKNKTWSLVDLPVGA